MQKFHRYEYVQIAEDLGPSMSHFQNNQPAIISGSYADQYGCSDTNNYSLYLLNEDGTKVVNRVSWYYEHQLSLLDAQDREKAQQLIHEYNQR